MVGLAEDATDIAAIFSQTHQPGRAGPGRGRQSSSPYSTFALALSTPSFSSSVSLLVRM